MRLIDADALIAEISPPEDAPNDGAKLILSVFIEAVKSFPAVDAVERAVYEQVVWERDMAIEQLKAIGKGFGEKMDDVFEVVRCWECKFNGNLPEIPLCPYMHYPNFKRSGDGYCSMGQRREEKHNAKVN